MRWLFSVALCSALLVSPVSAEPAEASRQGGSRIRPQDPRTKQTLRDGMARSETFRALVDRIEASNVFVYVSVSPFINSSLAGQLTWMTKAGPYRYVRATLSADQNSSQLIASLAHELQHALEVIGDDLVVNELTLVDLYTRIGHPSRAAGISGWETIAAQQTGQRVRRELAATAGMAMASAARLFDFRHL